MPQSMIVHTSYHKSSHVCSMELPLIEEVVPNVVRVGWAAHDYTHQVG